MVTKQQLEAYFKQLNEADYSKLEVFNQLVAEGFVVLNLSHKDFAREFGASIPTVERWRTGGNAPHPLIRKHIINWMKVLTASEISKYI